MKKHPSRLTISPTEKHILIIAKLAHFGFLTTGAEDIIKHSYQIKDYESLFLHVGDLGRFPIFLLVCNELEDIPYFSFLGQALTGECYASDFPDLIRMLLTERPLQTRLHLMDNEERAILEQQPSELKIYRGVTPQAVRGFSWTLSKEKAKFFAKRHLNYDRDSEVVQGICKKQDAIAYFLREEEIFIDPNNIQNITPIELFPRNRRSQPPDLKYIAYLKIKEYLVSNHLLPFLQ